MFISWTLAVVLGTAVVWIAYDVWAIRKWGWRGSESFTVRALTQRLPPLIFALGFLAGHWVWGQPCPY